MKADSNPKEAITLIEYIKRNFNDSQVDFAVAQDVAKQQVTQWINKGFIVVDDVLYSSRRELKRKL